MADRLRAFAPHKTLHGTISILTQCTKLAANVGKVGTVKFEMPLAFIPQCPAAGLRMEMPGDGWSSKPIATLLYRQSMRSHAELHQQL